MVWTGTFQNSTAELFDGIEGWFGIRTTGALLTPNVIPTQAIFTAANYAGRMIITGTGLAFTNQTVSGAITNPVFTAGTITRIDFLYNYALRAAADNGQDPTPFFQAAFLEPSAVLNLPNVSAVALSTAIVQSYSTPTPTPLRAFFSSDRHFYTGDNGVNLMAGYDNDDILIGLGGNDFLQGDAGNDTLDGGPGTDGLNGGPGNDYYLPGPKDPASLIGDSVSDGGTTPGEIDTLSYENATEGLTIDLNALDGNQSTGWATGLTVGGIERVIGSAFNDVIVGTDFPESITDTAADTLVGGSGDDQLFGLGGSDILQGGPGFDVLIGGANGDVGSTGPGDVAQFNAALSQIDVFFPGDGSVLVAAPGGGVDQLFEMEFIGGVDGTRGIGSFAASSKNLVIGDADPETLGGTSGIDLIFGRDGNDTLNGLGGNDRLEAENGNDSLNGGTGDD